MSYYLVIPTPLGGVRELQIASLKVRGIHGK